MNSQGTHEQRRVQTTRHSPHTGHQHHALRCTRGSGRCTGKVTSPTAATNANATTSMTMTLRGQSTRCALATMATKQCLRLHTPKHFTDNKQRCTRDQQGGLQRGALQPKVSAHVLQQRYARGRVKRHDPEFAQRVKRGDTTGTCWVTIGDDDDEDEEEEEDARMRMLLALETPLDD
jgi:hypothetical protein